MAERMKRLLSNNQSGYIPRRNISGIIRFNTKIKKLPSLLLFIDFKKKAFDSLEWDFLEKCFENFNFGPYFRRWVHIFYNNVQSCVINNGLCSLYPPYIPRSKAPFSH